MKTPAKINASRDESGKMLIGLDGTGAGLLLLAGRIASGVLVTVASNEKELAELKNVMHKMIDEACKGECYAADGRLQNPPGGIRRRHGDWREATGGHAGRKFRRYGIERRKGGGVQGKAPRLRQSKV